MSVFSAAGAAVVGTLALLVDLCEEVGTPKVPAVRESDRLGGGALPPSLEAEALVGAVRLEGSLAGRVGDFGFGLTNPADGDNSNAAGFLAVEDATGFVAGLEAWSLVADEAGFFSGAFPASLAGLFGCLAVNGDLAGFETVLADVEIGV